MSTCSRGPPVRRTDQDIAGSEPICRACQNTDGNEVLAAREMMFGRRDWFDYVRCGVCGALSIATIPEDLDSYYPSDYYSFTSVAEPYQPVLSHLKRLRSEFALRAPAWIARRLSTRVIPVEVLRLTGLGLTTRSRVCDVGCGGGDVLIVLRRQGFRNLRGIDPFLPQSEVRIADVALLRQRACDLEGSWDVFTMHHVLEHVADPLGELQQLAARLEPDGAIVIGVPLADGWCAKHYGSDWVQIDAPRHLMVPTVKAMNILADAAGLRVQRVTWDSWSMQFWGSEQNRLDIPMMSADAYRIECPGSGPFPAEQIAEWERRAVELNRIGAGDAASFVLRHR